MSTSLTVFAEPYSDAIPIHQPLRANQHNHVQRNWHQFRPHAPRERHDEGFHHHDQRHQAHLDVLRHWGPLSEGHGHGHQRSSGGREDARFV
jgi:hypothetical protein